MQSTILAASLHPGILLPSRNRGGDIACSTLANQR